MRKLFREPLINAQDLAPHVPSEWRDAANELLDMDPDAKDEMLRLLNDVRMRKFWSGFDALVSSAHSNGRLGGGLDRWLEDSRRSILLQLATKGGARPNQTAGEMKRFRRGIAKSVESLIVKMSEDSTIARIDVEEALYWMLHGTKAARAPDPGTPQRRYLGKSGEYESAPKFLADTVPNLPALHVVDMLRALAKRLRSDSPLGWLDPIDAPRGVTPRAHLEHALLSNFAYFLDPLPADLFAPAIEVALNEPKGNVDVTKLSDRLRKIPARKAKKNSDK